MVGREINEFVPRIFRIGISKPFSEELVRFTRTPQSRTLWLMIKDGLYKKTRLCSKKFADTEVIVSEDDVRKLEGME